MLRRPVDQAKLLFLYFLKSSAAFASEPAKTGILKASQQQTQNLVPASLQRMELESMGGHISLRIARRADIPLIQRCNLATLPENYNENFYVNHLRNWPELALVANIFQRNMCIFQKRILRGRKSLVEDLFCQVWQAEAQE